MECGDHNGREMSANHMGNVEAVGGRAADSGKSVKFLAAVAAAVFVAAAVASFFVLRPSTKHIVEVVQDETILYTIDLNAAEDMTFTVIYPQGSSNTITVQDGAIWVSEAECPDHTCMKMGKLRSERLPIVCLPNHLLIRFAEL